MAIHYCVTKENYNDPGFQTAEEVSWFAQLLTLGYWSGALALVAILVVILR